MAVSSVANSLGFTIIKDTTAGITKITCQSVKMCNTGRNGARMATRANASKAAATVRALSTPALIANVFLPSSPSMSSMSFTISLERLYKNPIKKTDHVLVSSGLDTPAAPNTITRPTEAAYLAYLSCLSQCPCSHLVRSMKT